MTVSLYDFRRPAGLKPLEQTRLHSRIERFLRETRLAVAAVIPLPVTLQSPKSATIYARDARELLDVQWLSGVFPSSAGMPAVYAGLDDLGAACLLAAMLGGASDVRAAGRMPTDLERELLLTVLARLANPVRTLFTRFDDGGITPGCEPYHRDALGAADPYEPYLQVSAQISAGGATGTVILAAPLESVRATLTESRRRQRSDQQLTTEELAGTSELPDYVEHATVSVVAILGEGSITVGDLLGLAPGDVLPLDQSAALPVKVLVDGQERMSARPGARGRRVAVQIEDATPD